MFPQYEIKINEDEITEGQPRGRTVDFDFTRGEFILRDGRVSPLDGVDALKARIEKCLRTVAGKPEIYRQDALPYGVNTFDLTDRSLPFAFLCAEIEREVTDALLRDSEIIAVTDFTFQRAGRTLETMFTVQSIYGEQEVTHAWLTV